MRKVTIPSIFAQLDMRGRHVKKAVVSAAVPAFIAIMVSGIIIGFTPARVTAAIAPLPGPFGSKGTLLAPARAPATSAGPAVAAVPMTQKAAAMFTCADLRRAA